MYKKPKLMKYFVFYLHSCTLFSQSVIEFTTRGKKLEDKYRMKSLVISCLLLIAVFPCFTVAEPYVLGCYFTNWSQHRQGLGYFTPSNIDPLLCTHLYYAFATIDIKARVPSPLEPNDVTIGTSTGMYEEFNRLKTKNRRLKTLLSLGGATVNSSQFRMVFESDRIRREFIRTTIKYLRKYQFDGLDLDWEYPESANDRQLFSSMVRDYRIAFQHEASHFNRTRLLLTAAVAAYRPKIEAAYEIKELATYLDYINLMTYDYHGSLIFFLVE